MSSTPDHSPVLDRNIRALIEHRKQEEARRSWSLRLADIITGFTGSMLFVGLHLVFFGAWIAINAGGVPMIPRFDETFVMLAMIASVEAIFLSTFVLISQNRMMALSERRAELDVQINLLTEHEVTRVLTLVTEIARRLGVDGAHDPELEVLARDVVPEQVLDRIEEHLEADEDLRPPGG